VEKNKNRTKVFASYCGSEERKGGSSNRIVNPPHYNEKKKEPSDQSAAQIAKVHHSRASPIPVSRKWGGRGQKTQLSTLKQENQKRKKQVKTQEGGEELTNSGYVIIHKIIDLESIKGRIVWTDKKLGRRQKAPEKKGEERIAGIHHLRTVETGHGTCKSTPQHSFTKTYKRKFPEEILSRIGGREEKIQENPSLLGKRTGETLEQALGGH